MNSYTQSDMQSLKPGDHIWIRKQGYTHHGLYLGESDIAEPLVIHYAGWVHRFDAGPLEITDLTTFVEGKRLHVRQYPKRAFSREDSVLRALSRLGEEQYDVQTNNCEHLCHWAIMGDQRSKQVEWVDTVLGAIHPGLEAASRCLSTLRTPKHTRSASTRQRVGDIAKDLAIDWSLKSAARWAGGPVGVAVYVGYRVSKQWLRQRQR